MRDYLWNRFTWTFGILVLTVLLWNVYVVLNDDGRIVGRVVDPQGQPLADAEVTIEASEINNLTFTPRVATTDAEGRFRLEGVTLFNFNMTVTKEGWQPVNRQNHHLYFRSQNYTLPAPVLLQPAPASASK